MAAAERSAMPKPVTKTGSTFLNRSFSELIAERSADLAELKLGIDVRNCMLLSDHATKRRNTNSGVCSDTC